MKLNLFIVCLWFLCGLINVLQAQTTTHSASTTRSGTTKAATTTTTTTTSTATTTGTTTTSTPLSSPNIVLFVADDLGWNDISYNGATDCYTPNIDELMSNSANLFYHYTFPMCTPTRAALMTGRQPYRYGFQHDSAMSQTIESGVPLNETFLSQALQDNGYNTYMTGKWHLGYYKWDYTPNYKGFGDFVGYYGDSIDYYDYNNDEGNYTGIDFHNNTSPYNATKSNNYSFAIYQATINNWIQEAISYSNKPFFWYIAHQSPHTPVDIISAYIKVVGKKSNYTSSTRKNYCALVYGLDYTVGRTVTLLKENNLWNNTYFIFFSDNGASSGLGSGYPLRGVKKTLFEGGIRTPAFVTGGKLPSSMKGQKLTKSAHVTDWFDTICSFAGIDCSGYNLDGIDLSNYLTTGTSPTRDYLLLNVDSISCTSIRNTKTTVCGGIRYNEWKLVVGNQINGGTSDYYWDINYINNSFINYSKATVDCNGVQPTVDTSTDCAALNSLCLYNISNDPCEYNDVSSQYSSIASQLLTQLTSYYNAQIKPVQFTSTYNGSGADPSLHGGYWSPWRDSSTANGVTYTQNNNDVATTSTTSGSDSGTSTTSAASTTSTTTTTNAIQTTSVNVSVANKLFLTCVYILIVVNVIMAI